MLLLSGAYQFEEILSGVLQKCGCAGMLSSSWLCLPTTQSIFWNMAFFGVYWFLSRTNLKRGGCANHSSRQPTVLNLSDDRSGKCMCRVLHRGGALHKSIFENVGQLNSSYYAQPLNTCNSTGECAVTSNPFMSFKHCLWQVISY